MKHTIQRHAWSVWPGSIILLAVMLLTSCASASSQARTATASVATPLPYPTATPGPLTMQNAWGALTVRHFSTGITASMQFNGGTSITPDGRYLVGGYAPISVHRTTAWYIALYDLQTNQVIPLQQAMSPTSQSNAVSADDHWVVWAEASDQSFFDWRLFAYNRQSGQTEQVASASLVQGRPAQGPGPEAYVDHGLMVWGQAIGDVTAQTGANAVVYMLNLETGQKSLLATNAGSPIIAWPWVMWDQADSTGGYEEFKNLTTGQIVKLDQIASTISISGNSVAYIDAGYHTVNLLDDITKDTTHPQILAIANRTIAEHLQFVSLNSRLVGWSSDVGTQLAYDRLQRRIVVLPKPSDRRIGAVWITGPYLIWSDDVPMSEYYQDVQDGTNPINTLYLVDSRTLPATAP